MARLKYCVLILILQIIIVPSKSLQIDTTDCIVRLLTSSNREPLIDNLNNDLDNFTRVIGSPHFFSSTNFSLPFKTTRLSMRHCNIFFIPSSTTFIETTGVMISSGFMFTENALFIVIIKAHESSELWQKFGIGVAEPEGFPAIYTQLIFVTQSIDGTRLEQYVYCWLCSKDDKFHKMVSLGNITKLHQQLNWIGRGLLSKLITGGLTTKTLTGQTCLEENLYNMKHCYFRAVVLAISLQRLNMSVQIVDSKPDEKDFVHSLYIDCEGVTEDELSLFEKQINPFFTIFLSQRYDLVYCKVARNMIEPNWRILLLPLDLYVWIFLLIAIFLVITILNR
jgi:hypothetical protein